MLGNSEDSAAYWRRMASEYERAVAESPYHAHRLNVIKALIPWDALAPGVTVVDFGCGDGVLLPMLAETGATVVGVDPNAALLASARKRMPDLQLIEGGVEALAALPRADVVLSFNVLAYLTNDEEQRFYRALSRTQQLAVTHSNELFDLFSCNAYTVDFFARHFAVDIGTLLTHPGEPTQQARYNVRENPLTYKDKLLAVGFREVQQVFANRHIKPPPLGAQTSYPDTLSAPDWRQMFTCSIYGSRAVRV